MVRNATLVVIVLGLFFLSSCAGLFRSPKPRETVVRPIQREKLAARHLEIEDPASKASLWKASTHRDLFNDLRANNVGDLVTVNIVETAKASKKADTKTSRDSSIDAGITNALGWENKVKNLTSLGRKKISTPFSNTSMFDASMKNSFTGSGQTSRNESMTASITARVIGVTPSGNLFIKGTREVKVNNENQIITLTGLIRPADISPDNTVLSSYIGDAKITYSGSGPVSDKQRPGWLMRAVDFVWPF